jgi:hypothetical protein
MRSAPAATGRIARVGADSIVQVAARVMRWPINPVLSRDPAMLGDPRAGENGDPSSSDGAFSDRFEQSLGGFDSLPRRSRMIR